MCVSTSQLKLGCAEVWLELTGFVVWCGVVWGGVVWCGVMRIPCTCDCLLWRTANCAHQHLPACGSVCREAAATPGCRGLVLQPVWCGAVQCCAPCMVWSGMQAFLGALGWRH
jgi:hypothetical protein